MNISNLDWKYFIDIFPDPVACYDKAYHHLYINKAIANEINMPVTAVIGKSNRDLKIPNDEGLLSELESKIRSVFETGQPAVNFTQHEFPSETRFYYMKLTPEFQNQDAQTGEVQSVWAMTRDITQLKQTELTLKGAEENLQKQNQELIRLNSDLDAFFFTVSHDLRSPLSNIQSIIQMLKEDGQKDVAVLTEQLEKSTRRLSDVLTGLTDFVKLQHNRERAENINLDTVLQDVISEFQEQMHHTCARVQADFSQSPTLYYSKAYLESLFRNMISNAIKYRSATRPPQLTINASQETDFVVLTFQDNGQGIDLARNGQKIFDPFYQIDGDQEGKGMGLNIVKNILERNGGRIAVESEVGSGTTFTCYLKEV